MRNLSVHGDRNVNPKSNNMSTTSLTSMHTAINRSPSMQNLHKAYFPPPQVRWVTDSCHEILRLKILLGVLMGIQPASPAFPILS